MAVINRMGFNNKGVAYAVSRLKQRTFDGICGVNIGKNASTPTDSAADDYLMCFAAVYEHADYVTVNVSSPNTPGLRTLQSADGLRRVIGGLISERADLERRHGRHVPILVKIAPDLDGNEIHDIGAAVRELGIDGVVATNTTTNFDLLTQGAPSGVSGGLSGRPLHERSIGVVRALRASLGANIPIIGVGGITDSASAQEMFRAGADLIQVYTGFVYKGPGLLQEIYGGMPRAAGEPPLNLDALRHDQPRR
jgi:dihydroorotate dehydrogenase